MDEVKNEIETINSGKAVDYIKVLWKSNLTLMMTIVARSVFEDKGKFYLHVYLDECLYEL